MPAPKVGIVIINFNGEEDTTACLLSLRGIDYPDYEIVLVDNASRDASADRIKTGFPEITLIKNSDNLGFAEGNNVGIRYSLENGADYVLLLNNDTVVDKKFLTEIVSAAQAHPEAGVLGPKIYLYGEEGRIWYAGGYLNKITGKTFHRGLHKKDVGQFEQMTDVDFVSGCAMLIRRAVIEKIGVLDPDYFFSYEDVDFSLRAERAGFKLIYVPGSHVSHKFARSIGGRFSPAYIYYRVRNSLLFMKKNRFSSLKILYSITVNPLKMLAFSLMTGNLKGVAAVAKAVSDFLSGKSGRARWF